jgi:hypothetical protein
MGYKKYELIEIARNIRKYANRGSEEGWDEIEIEENDKHIVVTGKWSKQLPPVQVCKLALMADQIETIIPDDYEEQETTFSYTFYK